MGSHLHTCNCVSVRLDETNYATWVYLMFHHLRGHGLAKFVDDSHPCPSQFHVSGNESVSVDKSEAYERWEQQDSFVVSMITSTLSVDALTLVIGCETSLKVWSTLKQHYAPTSEFHISQLKSTMQNIRKGSETIDRYLLRFKSARDNLAASGFTMNDQDVMYYILDGLPVEYGPTRQIIRSIKKISMEELRSLLLSAEYEIKLQRSSSTVPSLDAMLAEDGIYRRPSYLHPLQWNGYVKAAHGNDFIVSPTSSTCQSASMSSYVKKILLVFGPQNGFIQQPSALQMSGDQTTCHAPDQGTFQLIHKAPGMTLPYACTMPSQVEYNVAGISCHNSSSQTTYISPSSMKGTDDTKQLDIIKTTCLTSEAREDVSFGDTIHAAMPQQGNGGCHPSESAEVHETYAPVDHESSSQNSLASSDVDHPTRHKEQNPLTTSKKEPGSIDHEMTTSSMNENMEVSKTSSASICSFREKDGYSPYKCQQHQAASSRPLSNTSHHNSATRNQFAFQPDVLAALTYKQALQTSNDRLRRSPIICRQAYEFKNVAQSLPLIPPG